jgi:acyl-CoA thioester hydrolase
MADYFEFPVRVYYEDTDAGGVVFYANYLRFFERGRTEWLRHGGISQYQMTQEHGVMFVVSHAEIDYLRPARLDDVLRIRSRVDRLARVAVTFQQEAWRDSQDGPELLSTSQIKVGCVSFASLRPVPIPDAVRSALEP